MERLWSSKYFNQCYEASWLFITCTLCRKQSGSLSAQVKHESAACLYREESQPGHCRLFQPKYYQQVQGGNCSPPSGTQQTFQAPQYKKGIDLSSGGHDCAYGLQNTVCKKTLRTESKLRGDLTVLQLPSSRVQGRQTHLAEEEYSSKCTVIEQEVKLQKASYKGQSQTLLTPKLVLASCLQA